jgi:NAD-dependent histone deacetylase SIR2
LADPQEVFDIGLFREDPSIFYQVAKDILPSSKKYSPTHAFIRLLQDKGKLLTNFTQNIDNLEGHAGIRPDKLIQCHGSFATATCIECKYKVPCEKIYYDLKAGKVAKCDRCIERIRKVKPGMKRKRSSEGSSKSRKKRQSYEDSTDEEEDDIAVAGVMKVYLYEKQMPNVLLTVNKARHHILWRRPTCNIP